MNQTFGFLTLAIKNPYYGRMAFNMCATLKAADSSLMLAVIADRDGLSHLSERQKGIFDIIVPVSDEIKHGVSLKLQVDKLSPFDKTIFVDADTFFVPSSKPGKIFESMPDDVYFTAITEGYFDFENDDDRLNYKYTLWATADEIKEVYLDRSIGKKIYQWRSEFFYFKKSDELTAMFDLARNVYEEPNLVTRLKFVNGVPDELAINVACLLLDIHPHVFKWQPTYWANLYGARIPSIPDLIAGGYYNISCGGSGVPGMLKNTYNRIVHFSLKRLGRQHVFELMPKRAFIRERSNT